MPHWFAEYDHLRTGGTAPLPGGAPRPAAWACQIRIPLWRWHQSLKKQTFSLCLTIRLLAHWTHSYKQKKGLILKDFRKHKDKRAIRNSWHCQHTREKNLEMVVQIFVFALISNTVRTLTCYQTHLGKGLYPSSHCNCTSTSNPKRWTLALHNWKLITVNQITDIKSKNEEIKSGKRNGTFILASKRLNMGAFFSISGITMNLQNSELVKIQNKFEAKILFIEENEYTPDFAASDENMLELRDLPIL